MTAETMPAAPVETVTPIKPSEAIRLGCLIRPVQAFDGPGDFVTSSCVQGAYTDGSGGDYMSDQPWARELLRTRCPAAGCHEPPSPLHLNDHHRWTREQIADWLEGLGL